MTNVISPFAMSEVRKDLEKVNYVTVYTDASNHTSTKLVPLMVRYFNYSNGVQVKVLDFQALLGETADIISSFVLKTLGDFNLESKVVGLCVDNTNTNFGGSLRKGSKNVNYILQNSLKRSIVGVGCSAHIVNNAIQTAVDSLPVCVESIVQKIYSYFHIYSVREASLVEFCDFVDVEFSKVLGYSRTRWLSMLPAIERVLKLYPALKSYFESQDRCPTVIKQFLTILCLKCGCILLSQATVFHNVVLLLEGQNVAMV